MDYKQVILDMIASNYAGHQKVRLIKLIDTRFDGNHPNGINVDYTKEGYEVHPLELGETYKIVNDTSWFRTSTVVEINDDGTFHTENSVYKLEKLSS